MSRAIWLLGGLSVLGVALAAPRFYQAAAPAQMCSASTPLNSAGMCPWRNPDADRLAFFPGSDRSEQHLLILSDLRVQTLQRLGTGDEMDANGIYCYRIYKGQKQLGAVLAQRAAGEYGAVEYVEALSPIGRIVGVRIQRLREPDTTAAAIEARPWLNSFAGKSPDSKFDVGGGLPRVPTYAAATASSLARSIRRSTIEYDVALENGR